MDGGEDEVCYLRVRCCEEGNDRDGCTGGGMVGLVVDYYAGSRGSWCWCHLSEERKMNGFLMPRYVESLAAQSPRKGNAEVKRCSRSRKFIIESGNDQWREMH